MVRAQPTCNAPLSRHHAKYANAHRRTRVSMFAAINQPPASRNLSQNHLPCKFTPMRQPDTPSTEAAISANLNTGDGLVFDDQRLEQCPQCARR